VFNSASAHGMTRNIKVTDSMGLARIKTTIDGNIRKKFDDSFHAKA